MSPFWRGNQLILFFKFFCKIITKISPNLHWKKIQFFNKNTQKIFRKKKALLTSALKCKLIKLHDGFMGIILKPKDGANFPSVIGGYLTQWIFLTLFVGRPNFSKCLAYFFFLFFITTNISKNHTRPLGLVA
jgi:hypothetical protein